MVSEPDLQWTSIQDFPPAHPTIYMRRDLSLEFSTFKVVLVDLLTKD